MKVQLPSFYEGVKVNLTCEREEPGVLVIRDVNGAVITRIQLDRQSGILVSND